MSSKNRRPTLYEWIAVYKALTEEQRKRIDKLVKIFSEAQSGVSERVEGRS